jgi:NTP pyrophosphatase (non-canonical NTP hydrolase)
MANLINHPEGKFGRTAREIRQREVLRDFANQCIGDSKKYFPETAKSLAHSVLALCGETGELANIVKKIERGDRSVEVEFPNLTDEVADIFIYLMNVVGMLGIDLATAYEVKREFNNERFIKSENRTDSSDQLA